MIYEFFCPVCKVKFFGSKLGDKIKCPVCEKYRKVELLKEIT